MHRLGGPVLRRPPRALALAAVLLAVAPATASAGRSRADRVCAPRADLHESPGGLRIGVIAGGRPVIVLKRTSTGRWVRVRTTIGARGWVRARLLCDEGRG